MFKFCLKVIISSFLIFSANNFSICFLAYANELNTNESLPDKISQINEKIKKEPSDYHNYFELAKIYYEQKNYAETIKNLEKIFDINDSDPRVYLLMGQTLISTNNSVLAILALNHGIECYNAAKINDNKLITKLYQTRLNAFLILDMYSKALLDIDKLIKLEPKKISYYLQKGKIYCESGDFDKALENYQNYIKLDQTNSEAFDNLALVYQIKSQYNKALECQLKALKIKKCTQYLIHLSTIYAGLDKNKLALKTLNAAAKSKENSIEINYLKAFIYDKTNKYNRALLYINKALKLAPKNQTALMIRGQIYYNAKKYSQALSDLNNVCAGEDHNILASELIAKIDLKTNKPQLCIDQCQKLLEIYPQSLTGLTLKAQALANLDKFDEAYKTIDQAKTILGDNYYIYYVESKILYQHNDLAAAKKAIDQSLSLNSNYKKALSLEKLLQKKRKTKANKL